MSKILIPDALKTIADEKNFFLYQMPFKIPVGVGRISVPRNTDEAAVSTLWECVEKLEYLERKPEVLERVNREREEWARKHQVEFKPIAGFRVGYVPREESAGVVVDMDKCVGEDGVVVVDDFGLQEAFDRYVESGGYWEISPSGTGVRVVMPRGDWDELKSDRREAGGVAFQAAQEKAKGFTLTLEGSGEWLRDDALIEEVVRVRDEGLVERKRDRVKVGGAEDIGDVALEWAHVSVQDLEDMLAVIPNEGFNSREVFVGMTKAVKEAFEPRGLGEAAWDVWDAWVATQVDSVGGYDYTMNRRLWDEPSGRVGETTLGTIIHHARENGWGTSEEKIENSEETEDPFEWMENLDVETVGVKKKVTRPVYNYINCVRVVRNMPRLKGLIGRDVLCGGLLRMREWDGGELEVPVEWTDIDMHRLLQTVQGFKKGGKPVFGHYGIEGLKSGIEGAAKPVQPIARMLERVGEWDGVERIDGWLEKYFGVNEPLGRVYARKFMIGLVARGRASRGRTVKMDTVLVLRGEQGRNKSSFFELLARGFFTDHVGEIRKKESLENIAGRWVVELSEGDVVSKADRRFLNGFLTRVEDRFRPSYARNVETFPRACVFVMPTNDQDVLMDPTGSRRFWPVTVHKKADLEELKRERELMLAEALVALEKGEKWWLTDEEEAIRVESAGDYEMELSVEEPMERLLRDVPEGQIVSMSEILTGLGLSDVGVHTSVSAEIKTVFRKWGWDKARTKAKRGYRRGVTGDSKPPMSDLAKEKLESGEVVAICEFRSEEE